MKKEKTLPLLSSVRCAHIMKDVALALLNNLLYDAFSQAIINKHYFFIMASAKDNRGSYGRVAPDEEDTAQRLLREILLVTHSLREIAVFNTVLLFEHFLSIIHLLLL